MKAIIKNITNLCDYVTHRYQCSIASSPSEVHTCMQKRKTVFGTELQRNRVTQTMSPAESDHLDEHSFFMICRDSYNNQIIASCRLTYMSEIKKNSEFYSLYQLNRFPKTWGKNVMIVSRFFIEKPYRKKLVSLQMMQKVYEFGLDNNILFALMVCEPGLYHLYHKVGYQSYCGLESSQYGGYRIPMYFQTHDFDYLKRIHSPLYPTCKNHSSPYSTEELIQIKKMISNYPEDEVGIKLVENHYLPQHIDILDGIKLESSKAFLKNSLLVKCKQNDKIMIAGSGDRYIGFIVSGYVNVEREGTSLFTLKSGEIFGENATILGENHITDFISASADTQIILFSVNCLNRIKDKEDRVMIWKNLSKIVSLKMMDVIHQFIKTKESGRRYYEPKKTYS